MVLPVGIAGRIAQVTAVGAHPDEMIHVDAFEYFRTHWLRPTPGSEEVAYSPNGWSRVYNGEIVYLLYGKIGALPRRLWPNVNPDFIYRFCNVGLLFITLLVLATARCRLFAPWLLGIFLVCIPQVIYVFSYANSDAFGVAMSVLLFVQVARMLELSPRQWGMIRVSMCMLLFLCTLLAKVAFEMDILLPAGLFIFHLIRTRTPWRMTIARLAVPALVMYGLAAWWNPQISPWHKQWHRQMTAMRVVKAVPGRKPTDAGGWWGIYLADKGWTYRQMMDPEQYPWAKLSSESFYGVFGYMTIYAQLWVYLTVGYVALGSLVLTLIALIVYRAQVSGELLICMVSAVPLLAINIFGSMYHSLHFDWQPQGRYLFASLVPVFFLVFGSWRIEGKWWRAMHAIVMVALISFSSYVLMEYAVLNLALR